jgi:hypothetical protein
MTRNLKRLGLGLLAILAVNAVMGATAASAAPLFTSEAKETVVTGSTTTPIEFRITNTNTKVKCWTNKFASTFKESEVFEATVSATYFGTEKEPNSQNCELAGGAVQVSMNGCDYKWFRPTGGEEEGQPVGPIEIVCPEGNEIEVSMFGCVMKIHPQTPTAGGLIYENGTVNKKDDISVKLKLTGLTYTMVGAICIGFGSKEGDNLDVFGSVTLLGYEDTGEPTGDEFKEGAQVGIKFS